MADPVVPSGLNTLTIPARHLPLGRATDCPSGQSRWTVWIPSRFGGQLSVEQEQDATIDIRDTTSTTLSLGQNKSIYDVPMGVWGELIILVDSAAAGSLVARFTQIYWSRQAPSLSAAPLIPYNFWFWPCERGTTWAGRAVDVLVRYGKAVGSSDPDPGNYERLSHQVDRATAWQGHCHNAAPASALFESPGDNIVGDGLHISTYTSFTSDEMKFLATEFFGNFGQIFPVWVLSTSIATTDPPRFSLLAYLKPSGPKTLPALVANLKTVMTPELAQSEATQAVTAAGGEAAFADAIDVEFGRNGAEFFTTLLKRLAEEGEPLIANMRAYSANAGPDEVWNQVYFHLSASYVETDNANDKFDLSVYCNLTSNLDKDPPIPDLPARIVPRGVDPGTSGQNCLQFFHQFRLVFSANGKVDETDTRSRWFAVTNSSGDALFAPTHMQRIMVAGMVRAEAKTPDETMVRGNPVVGRELLDQMNFNKRFG
jgi:hypothetical protein